MNETTQPQITPAEMADANAAGITFKFQAAIGHILDGALQTDHEQKEIVCVQLGDDEAETLKTLTAAFRDYQTGEAARRTSIRTPVPAQVQFPTPPRRLR